MQTKTVAKKSGVVLETSRFGTPTPTYYLTPSWVSSATPREVSAALHNLAARIEEATPPSEGWVVTLDVDRASVYLELEDGSKEEAKTGMNTLLAVQAQ